MNEHEKIAQHVEKVVNASPPLTEEQKDRIRAIFHGAAIKGQGNSAKGASSGQ